MQTLVLTGLLWAVIAAGGGEQTLLLTGLLGGGATSLGRPQDIFKIIGGGAGPCSPHLSIDRIIVGRHCRGGGGEANLSIDRIIWGGGASLGRPQDIFKIIGGGAGPCCPPPLPLQRIYWLLETYS